MRAAQQATGLTIEVLSSEDEARLGYVAAVNTSTMTDGAVLEIGGGSMQLIRVADRRSHELSSFRLGAVRMTEQFLPGSGPAKKKELQRVRAHVRKALEDATWLARSGERLVGIGGAVRNLAAAAQPEIDHLDIGVQGFVITPRRTSASWSRRSPRCRSPSAATCPGSSPGAGTSSSRRRWRSRPCSRSAASTGSRSPRPAFARACSSTGCCSSARSRCCADVREAAVRNLAIQYESDMAHVEHVARLALQMFDSLADGGLFEPGRGERELLWAASMLHDVGMTISYDDHHKHSST